MNFGPNIRHKAQHLSAGLPEPVGLLRDGLAGIVSALVTLAYCISFSALLFPGDLSHGLSLGLSALLVGSVIAGFIIALTTSLPPVNASPDTPAVAVMSMLSAVIAQKLHGTGSDTGNIVTHVLLALTLSTLVAGALLALLGHLRAGQWLRFIPYPVVAGFLAASGWLLLTGGIEVVIGAQLSLADLSPLIVPSVLAPLVIAAAFAIGVFVARRKIDSVLVLPMAFLLVSIAIHIGLWMLAFLIDVGDATMWFVESGKGVAFWWPWTPILAGEIDWWILASVAAEIGAVCGVTAIALLLDVTSLEVARAKPADLDREFSTNGVANVTTAMIGGVAGNLSLQGSLLIEESGGVSRAAGVISALALAIVLLVGAEIAGFIPRPLLGGMLAYLGIVLFYKVVRQLRAQGTHMDGVLALIIFLVIINWGYLVGVVTGILGACVLFAMSYSRIGVVRRHLTRAEFASNVERASEHTRFLCEEGRAIHLVWLSGYIFFGSSNGLFEYVKRRIDTQTDDPIRYLVLDFSGVPGMDSSAVLSLIKMRHYCSDHEVTIAVSGAGEGVMRVLENAGLTAQGDHRLFANRTLALEWCEDALLESQDDIQQGHNDLLVWLQHEMGAKVDVAKLADYFERVEAERREVIYRQGDPADTVDLVLSGALAVEIVTPDGVRTRVRRMMGQTVVGEMGFYRRTERVADVVAEQPSVLYRIDRETFRRLQQEAPQLAEQFNQFIIRVLADRLEFANRETSALL